MEPVVPKLLATVDVASMIVVPPPTPVATPLLLMVAMVVSDEVQATCAVMSWVEPSLK